MKKKNSTEWLKYGRIIPEERDAKKMGPSILTFETESGSYKIACLTPVRKPAQGTSGLRSHGCGGVGVYRGLGSLLGKPEMSQTTISLIFNPDLGSVS